MREVHENLKVIRFEGEMLPNWAQLLDLAARLSPVSEETRGWFSRFTNSTGVDDALTIITQSEILLTAIRNHNAAIIVQLDDVMSLFPKIVAMGGNEAAGCRDEGRSWLSSAIGLLEIELTWLSPRLAVPSE